MYILAWLTVVWPKPFFIFVHCMFLQIFLQFFFCFFCTAHCALDLARDHAPQKCPLLLLLLSPRSDKMCRSDKTCRQSIKFDTFRNLSDKTCHSNKTCRNTVAGSVKDLISLQNTFAYCLLLCAAAPSLPVLSFCFIVSLY